MGLRNRHPAYYGNDLCRYAMENAEVFHDRPLDSLGAFREYAFCPLCGRGPLAANNPYAPQAFLYPLGLEQHLNRDCCFTRCYIDEKAFYKTLLEQTIGNEHRLLKALNDSFEEGRERFPFAEPAGAEASLIEATERRIRILEGVPKEFRKENQWRYIEARSDKTE